MSKRPRELSLDKAQRPPKTETSSAQNEKRQQQGIRSNSLAAAEAVFATAAIRVSRVRSSQSQRPRQLEKLEKIPNLKKKTLCLNWRTLRWSALWRVARRERRSSALRRHASSAARWRQIRASRASRRHSARATCPTLESFMCFL